MSITDIPLQNDRVKPKGPLKAQPQERAINERALKRSLQWTHNHQMAEDHARNGDVLLENQDYSGACACYVDATVLWGSNPVYYNKLAEAYIKSDLFAEAAHSATRALALNPQYKEARYHRGTARAAQGLLKAAKVDFELILAQDPTDTQAQSSLSNIIRDLSLSSIIFPTLLSSTPSIASTPFNTPSTATVPPNSHLSTVIPHATTLPVLSPNPDPVLSNTQTPNPTSAAPTSIDFSYPSPDLSTPALYAPSLSDSSDCFHVGNGIPCRFYNTHPSGCALGPTCRFSHSPDEKSVRDSLGKNVCTYHLLSLCKFGASKCVYSHCTSFLPDHEGAWWASPEGVESVRKVVELAEKRAKWKRKSIVDVGKKEKAAKDPETGTPKTGAGKAEGEKGDEHGKASTPKSGKKGRGMPSPMSPLLRRQFQKKLTTPGSAPLSKKVGASATSPLGPVSADARVSEQTVDVGAGPAAQSKQNASVLQLENAPGNERVDVRPGAVHVVKDFAPTSSVLTSPGDILGTDPGQTTEVERGAASALAQHPAEAEKKLDVEV